MYKVTRSFVKNEYEDLKKESKDFGKEKMKLSFWHHFNNMLVSIEKFLKSIPTSREEIYKSERKDLKEILNKYLKDTNKTPDHIRYKKVKKIIDEIDEDLKNYKENEKDVIDVKDKKIKYGIFNSKTKITKPLFPDKSGLPTFGDVKQGYTDLDCYFLAVLMSIVKNKNNSKVIVDCFPDYPKNGNEKEIEEFNASKKIKVRFYKVKIENGKCLPDGKVDIIIDKTALRGGGAPWVRILEKAFAVYRSKGYDFFARLKDEKSKTINSRIIDGLNGGSSSLVMTAITGKGSQSTYQAASASGRKKFSGKYSNEDVVMFNKIKNALDKDKAVTAGAPPHFNKFVPFYSKGLFLGHVYSVFKAEEENGIKYITVGNPYKGRIRVYDKNHKSKSVTPKEKDKRGISKLELNDFLNYFSSVDISD